MLASWEEEEVLQDIFDNFEYVPVFKMYLSAFYPEVRHQKRNCVVTNSPIGVTTFCNNLSVSGFKGSLVEDTEVKQR